MTQSTEPEQRDESWREEYLGMKAHGKLNRELLMNGPKSLAQSWLMQAMHNDWRKKKGIKTPEPPNVQSSLKEFFQRNKDQGI
tara:strand:+ start:177 stop:425 length:249 start_codon:yes stop_codon:yes gene_type:complete